MRKINPSVPRKITKEEIRNKTRIIIADKLGVEVDDIDDSSLLREDLAIDSFDALRLIFEIEDEFNITVPPTKTANIKKVKDIYTFISNHLSELGK